MKAALGHAADNPIKLDSQMRVKGGSAYLKYIQNVLDGTQDECRAFGDYDFVLHDDFSDFVSALNMTIKNII